MYRILNMTAFTIIYTTAVALLLVGASIARDALVVPCGKDDLCCREGETCCRLRNNTFGCFPEEDAVCCDGTSFACKKDYTCHMQFGMCIETDMVLPPMESTHGADKCSHQVSNDAVPMKRAERILEDTNCGAGYCSGNSTCCNGTSSNVGLCCPMLTAVCCGDGMHCCPSGYTCDMALGGCKKNTAMSFKKLRETSKVAKTKLSWPEIVFCPDHTACYDDQTCCQLQNGRFGCCPDEHGVCCPDGLHCCPQGSTCDVGHQKCVKHDKWVALVTPKPKKQANKLRKPLLTEVVCPDPSYKCADNTTCCHLSSGVYGCCPYPNAVCCTDGNHCCPSGYTCDSIHQRCISSSPPDNFDRIMPLRSKEKAEDSYLLKTKSDFNSRRLGEVLCPDKSSVCEDGTTCCQMADGTYGCCPYANATCCADHQHCCPQGYTCDLVHQQCAQSTRQDIFIPLSFVIIEAVVTDNEPVNTEESRQEEPLMKNELGPMDAIDQFKEVISFVDNIIANIGDNEPQSDKPSCSAIDALMMGCPQGTTCCRPVGDDEKPVCCPGSGSVSCCSGGFCCPDQHECNPFTMTCERVKKYPSTIELNL